MSERYKLNDHGQAYFVTFTVVGWVDVFSRETYKDIFLESLRYCIKNKGLTVYAWVIMTNHVHLIIGSDGVYLSDIVRDLKKYTSRQIVERIKTQEEESRKAWMLNMFNFVGKSHRNETNFQLWQFGYHPVELDDDWKFEQRLNYLHENPVRSGMVWEAWHYKYSSAIDYYTDEKGLLDIELYC